MRATAFAPDCDTLIRAKCSWLMSALSSGHHESSGPHLTALWFIWDGSVLWLNSIVKSQRWTDIVRDPG